MTNEDFIKHLKFCLYDNYNLVEYAKKLVAVAEAIDKAEIEGYMLPIFVKEALEKLESE